MKYFNNIESLDDLKTQYKTLARKNHPDMGGTLEAMQQINVEFDMLFAVWQNADKHTKTNKNKNETAESFTSCFYKKNGWTGSRYDYKLSCKEIGKMLKVFCKTVYPLCKFSIVTTWNTIRIALMECNYNVFTADYDNYIQINHYSITKDERLTEQARKMLKVISDYLSTYNYDYSDAMIDYFNRRFYESFTVGKWDQPFKMVEKIERIETEQTTADIKNDTYTYDIKEDIDTRDNSKIFVVKVLEKLSKEEYIKLSNNFKKLGGYYSKFKHGFLFKEYPTNIFN